MNADVIFAGDIITVDDAHPTAEALAVANGRIVAVGARDEVLGLRGAGTRVVDLDGRTLAPAFIDPHSHYINSLMVANQVNVYAPPAGPGTDVAAIVSALRKFRDAKGIGPTEVIIGYGYDDTLMPNGRVLHASDLDADFPDNPVIVQHVSLHGGVLNSAALRRWGITADTPTPPGGVIVRKPGSHEPDGLLMETAFLPVFASLPKPTRDQEIAWSKAGQALYAAAGITTAQEGLSHRADIDLLYRAAQGGATLIDVVAYPFILDLEAVLQSYPASAFGTYRNRVKLGGVKVTLDGSPQGRTAYFTAPYLVEGPEGQRNWRGEEPFPQETINGWFKAVYDLGLQLLIHANGDAAIDMLLDADAAASAGSDADRRTVSIHSQFARRDQLARFKSQRVIPSFFTSHAFYFADAHIRLRGREQADFLSPMRAAIDLGLAPTNHTDFNVTPIDQLFLMWSAVNRVSRSGEVIGADQRVTPLEALKAVTLHAAYQYFEEDTKGSVEVGKLADLVILDANPLTVDPMAIKDIKVVETIKEGQTIYAA